MRPFYVFAVVTVFDNNVKRGIAVSYTHLETENDTSRNKETEIKLIQTAANFLGKQLES